jgi:hypothetical protein
MDKNVDGSERLLCIDELRAELSVKTAPHVMALATVWVVSDARFNVKVRCGCLTCSSGAHNAKWMIYTETKQRVRVPINGGTPRATTYPIANSNPRRVIVADSLD